MPLIPSCFRAIPPIPPPLSQHHPPTPFFLDITLSQPPFIHPILHSHSLSLFIPFHSHAVDFGAYKVGKLICFLTRSAARSASIITAAYACILPLQQPKVHIFHIFFFPSLSPTTPPFYTKLRNSHFRTFIILNF